MFRLCRLVAVLLFSINAGCYAQHVTVSVADTTHVQDSLHMLQQKSHDIMQTGTDAANRLQTLQKLKQEPSANELIPDTIRSAVEKGTKLLTRKIYSEKRLAAIRDSLAQAVGIPNNIPLKREISEEELINMVNKKFPGESESKLPNQLESATKDSVQSNIPGKNDIPDLNEYRLSVDDLGNMAPLPGSIVKSKYIKSIDSIRQINLHDAKLKYNEKALTEHAKLAKFQQKPTFKERSYFEGILGLATGKAFTIYSASPALGFHFWDWFSLGAGPNLQLIAVDKEIKFNGGIRAFSKVEFWKRQLYVQLEDSMNPWSPTDERIQLNEHNVMVGGGVLLSVNAPVTLNFSMMYSLSENKTTVSDISPFVFRIGISTVKIQK